VEPRPQYLDDLPARADLVIVGGGVVGAATAFFAARAGLRAVVLERRTRLALLTTAASTGAFRLQFDNEEELALVREGAELFLDFGARTGLEGADIGVRQQGYLFASLAEASATRARALVERQRGWGLDDVEILDGDEARRRFPYLSAAVIQARFRPHDGWLDPRRLTHSLLAAAIDSSRIPGGVPGGSAAVVVGTDVTGFSVASTGRVTGVATSRGAIDADTVVLCAGPFTGDLALLAGVDLDIRPTRRQKLVFPHLPEVPAWAPMTIDEETAAHWRPALDGCYALWTEAGTKPEPPAHDVLPTRDWALALLDPASDHSLARVSTFWHDVWERGTDIWFQQAGQYEVTPDHRPYIGPTSVAGLWVNAGYSGHGIMTSPGGSRLLVELLTGRVEQGANRFATDRAIVGRERDIL
jgi:sarcosine oxidase subunit beta